MLRQGVTRNSINLWNYPVWTETRHNKRKVVINYRKLDVSVDDKYPQADNRSFRTIRKMPKLIDQEDIEKTALSIENGRICKNVVWFEEWTFNLSTINGLSFVGHLK